MTIAKHLLQWGVYEFLKVWSNLLVPSAPVEIAIATFEI